MDHLDHRTETQYNESFTRPIVKIGRWTMFAAIFLSFLPVLYLMIVYDAVPPLKAVLTGWLLIASIFAPYYFIEPISYFPILGMAGTYMSFLSGEIGNMRLPCSAVAQDALKVERGSKKAELVSTLAIAGSVVTSLVFGTLAVLVGKLVLGFLPDSVIHAFDYVLPSIFGAMFGMFAIKAPKYAAYALVLDIILVKYLAAPVYVVIPAVIFTTMAFAYIDYKNKKKKANTVK